MWAGPSGCGVRPHPLGLVQLHHGGFEVCERPLRQAAVLLEVLQQAVPQRLARQHARVAQHHQAVEGGKPRGRLGGYLR